MRQTRGPSGAKCLIFLLAVTGLCAQDEERPSGWIQTAPKEAALAQRGTRSPGALEKGDFLFRGDVLDSADGVVTFYYCGDEKSDTGTLYTLRGTLQIPAAGVPGPAPGLTALRTVKPCLLPTLERQPDVTTIPSHEKLGVKLFSKDEVMAAVPQLKDALAASSDDQNVELAAAVLLEQAGRRDEAAWEYQLFASNTSWQPRLLLHIQQLQEAPAHARSLNEPSTPANQSNQKTGNIYALVVGISHYEQSPLIANLDFAARDATAFADYLKSERGGRAEVKLLRDGEATSGAIRNYFLDLKKRAGKDDTVWLFIAAHGEMLPTGNAVPDDQKTPSIITYRAHPQDTNMNSFAMQEVQSWMLGKTVPFGRAMIFLDVCHAGHVAEFRTSPTGPGRDYFGILATTQGTDALAYESKIFDGGHGVFTYFVLRALNTYEARLPGATYLRAAPFSGYVFQHVQASTNFRQTPTPMLGTTQTAIMADFGKTGIDFKPTPIDRLRIPDKELNLAKGRRGVKNAPDQEGTTAKPPAAASADLQQIIDLEDRGEQVLLTYLRGEELPQTPDQFSEGERIFASALQLQPGSPYLTARERFCHGRFLVFQKKYADAIGSLRQSIRLEPRAGYAYNALGIAYLEMARYDDAAHAFQDAIDRAPLWAYPRHNLALAHWQQGQYRLAVADYLAAMEKAPTYFYLPYNLGLLYATLNQQKKAESMYRKAIGLAPWRVEPLTALGQLQASQGSTGKARENLRQAVDMTGQSESAMQAARQNYAVLLAKQRKTFDQAVGYWKQNVDYLPSQFSLAEAWTKAGEITKAIDRYQHILTLVPSSISARLEVARLMKQAGRPAAEIVAVFHAGLTSDPSNPVLLEQLGRTYQSSGQPEEARQAFASALEHTQDPPARKVLEKALKDITKAARR
jgi:tetratricopeptide (TPR) repeat protein